LTSLEWQVFENNGNIPKGSEGGTIDKLDEFLYFIGDYNTDDEYYKKIYRFNMMSYTWESVTSRGKLRPRKFHRTALVEKTLYVLSGRSIQGTNILNNVMKTELGSDEVMWEHVIDVGDEGMNSFGSTTNHSVIFTFGGFHGSDGDFSNRITQIDVSDSNLNIFELTEEYTAPQSRFFHSMNLISGEFYVFGGRNHKNIFNDLWKLNPESETWETVQSAGNIPSARYAFAANSQGDALAVWGGEDNIGLVNDLFIFNALTANWQLLTPKSSQIPNPAKGACLLFSIPYIYIYGGITSSGFSGALWEFNLWTMEYKLLSKKLELAYPSCFLYEGEIYVAFGTKPSSIASDKIMKYNLKTNDWTVHIKSEKFWSSTNQGVILFLNKELIRIGGQLLDSTCNNQIIFLNTEEEKIIDSIPEFPYKAAWAYYKNFIYIYGGGEVIGQNLRMGVASSRLYKISMTDILGSKMECSPGTEKTKDECTLCRAGTYSDGVGNSSCTQCTPGTFNSKSGATSNRQCYPCAENYYTKNYGSTFCYDCPTGYLCPPGSSDPLDLLIEVESGSEQPKIYNPSIIKSKLLSFQLAVGLTFLLIILTMFFFRISRDFLMTLDIYTDLHNYILNKPMVLRETRIGGVATLIFICAAIILIGTTLLNYTEANIAEIKGLVPKVVLDEEVDEYIADSLTVIIRFIRYGDDCSSSQFNYETQNIDSSSFSNRTRKDEDLSCFVEFSFKKCTIRTGAMITVTSTEKLCYTSGIFVNVSSSSSIPSESSSVLTSIRPDSGFVFIGSDPTQFFYTLTPSLFESEVDKWPKKLTGFHISSEYLPIPGAQHRSEDLSISSQLKVSISLDMSISGLFTKRYQKLSLLFVLSSLVGSIFGIMGAVGGGMKTLEKNLGRFKLFFRKRKNFDGIKDHRKDIFSEIYDDHSKIQKKKYWRM
jgi:hypothetical protein